MLKFFVIGLVVGLALSLTTMFGLNHVVIPPKDYYFGIFGLIAIAGILLVGTIIWANSAREAALAALALGLIITLGFVVGAGVPMIVWTLQRVSVQVR